MSCVVASLIDELVADHPDLPVVAEERCAESAEGPAQSELAVRRMAGRGDHVGGQAVERETSRREVRRGSADRTRTAEPAVADPVGIRGVGIEPSVPVAVAQARRKHEIGGAIGGDRVVGEGIHGHRRR